MAKITATSVKSFFTYDIWHVKLEKFPKWQRSFIRLLRIVLLAVKDFSQKQLMVRAAALSLYTTLSIIPVIAMVFGVAQGFGLEQYLTEQLQSMFANQPEILSTLLVYVHNILGGTKGGIIAGFGFVLLLWSVLQVLSNIEDAFNSIWHVKTPRTWIRKFTDYMSIILIAPLFIIISGVVTIFISTQIKWFAEEISFLGSGITHLIIISINLLPYLTTGILFFFLYLVMPNTRVKPFSALYAGVVAGVVFQIFQWGYVEFQVGVSRYNAIYGSFASIPLFITFLNFSWIIVLIGAEISYSVQNIRDYQNEMQAEDISHEMRMVYSVFVLHFISAKFKEGDKAPNIREITKRLQLGSGLCNAILDLLIKAKLVVEGRESGKNKDAVYLPAMDLARLNIAFVVSKIESVGVMKKSDSETLTAIKQLYNELEEATFKSAANKNIMEI